MISIVRFLLIGSTIIWSTAYAAEYGHKRIDIDSVAKLKEIALSQCLDEIEMPQLRAIQEGGYLIIDRVRYDLQTPKEEFDKMLPNRGQIVSEAKSIAKLSKDKGEIISDVEGHKIKCTYTFRTALKSKLGGKHHTFALLSDPFATPEDKKLDDLAEAREKAVNIEAAR